MSREEYANRPTYVDTDEVDDEVNMTVEKMNQDPSDEEGTGRHSGNGGRTGEWHEPVSPMPETAPFVPYCKKNYTQQTSWPLYLQRNALREYFSEFIGTFLLIIFGNGVVATKQFQAESYSITRDATGNVTDYEYINYNNYQSNASYLCVVFGWGMGLTMALYVTGKVSGGHVNPAVTLTNAVFGNLPWIKVPFYIICQFLGAMTAAACVYGLFRPFFDMRREIVRLDRERKGSTVTDTDALGGIFSTYPVNEFYGNAFCFWSEFCNTMLMQMVICGVGDEEQIPIRKNRNARRHTALKIRLYQQKKRAARQQRVGTGENGELTESDFNLIEDVLVNSENTGGNFFMTAKPIAIGLLIFELGIATGWCSGYALNPARDLGPRMVSAMIFRSTDPFTKASHYFCIPMFVPIFGCMMGQFLYTFFICPERVPAEPEEDLSEEKLLYLAHSPNGGGVGSKRSTSTNAVPWDADSRDVANTSGLDG